MKKNQLSIYLGGKYVGLLEQTLSGKKMFTYDQSTKNPISISMPIREEPYEDKICEAFFGGLLPESDAAKKIIGKKYGVSANNTFSIVL